MNVELTDGWALRSDGRQFILRHTTRGVAERDYRHRSTGEIVTRQGDSVESHEEFFFYRLGSVLRFMAEQELRTPGSLEDAVKRLDAILTLSRKLDEIGPSRVLQSLKEAV